ncbi:MAG: hypothetical protein HC869_00830 [Rhodospirillales bacterium]|nr:hypothetical protein [Rhodospirillales bacterium]
MIDVKGVSRRLRQHLPRCSCPTTVSIRAGKLPPAEANGVHYLKIPVKLGS